MKSFFDPRYFSKNQLERLLQYDGSFSQVVNTLHKCLEQSCKFPIENKNLSQNIRRQKYISNLQIILIKIIYLIKSQWQPEAVSAVKLSELIFRAHFSNNLLQTRDEKLKNFYFDVIRLFKVTEFASRPENLFEIFKHGQMIFNHPKVTSRSDFTKLRRFLELRLPDKIHPIQILKLRIKINELSERVETAFDVFIEILQGLDMLIQYATRLMKMSGLFLEKDPLRKSYKVLIQPVAYADRFRGGAKIKELLSFLLNVADFTIQE